MSRWLLALTLTLVALSSSSSALLAGALAQTAIEHAIQAGDWSSAAQQAEAALFAGGVPRERWVQLQLSLGVARGHLGETERAQRAFVGALALDPELRLSPEEPVEVRSPFMEARGFWSQHPDRLDAVVALSDDRSALLISLIDPAALVSRVVLHVRGVGQPAFQERSLAPAARLSVALDALSNAPGVEYSVALIDESANRLWELGSDAQPARALLLRSGGVAGSMEREAPAPAIASAGPYYIGAAVSLAVAAGSLAVAAVSHAEREQLAQRWNDGACDGDGSTRGEVCASERDQIERYQRLAIGFYAVAGAGLVAGIAALIAAPRAERAPRSQRALRCGSGPGLVGLGCGGRF